LSGHFGNTELLNAVGLCIRRCNGTPVRARAYFPRHFLMKFRLPITNLMNIKKR